MENTTLSPSIAKRNLVKHIVLLRWLKKNTIIETIAILYVSMYIYAAISKWMDYTMSREQIALMPLMTPIAHIIVWLLPLSEIVIALLIFLSKTRRIGLYTGTALMILFTLYILYMMGFYPKLPCSCGGFLTELSWTGHIVFNGVYIIMGISAIRLIRKQAR